MTKEYPEPLEHDFPFILYAASEAAATSRTPAIRRTDYEVFTAEYVLEGAGFLSMDGYSARIGKDCIYFLQPGMDHVYWQDRKDPWRKLFFVSGGPLAFALLEAYRMKNCYCIENALPLKKYFEEMKQASSDPSGQLPSLVFHRFLQAASLFIHEGSQSNIPPEVMLLKQALDEAVEGVFRLDGFAREQKVSQAHLIRLFKTHFSLTPYEYLMKRKMETACTLLQYSTLSIKEIAVRLNFSDPYYFSNYFKSRQKVSPREYRKNLHEI